MKESRADLTSFFFFKEFYNFINVPYASPVKEKSLLQRLYS